MKKHLLFRITALFSVLGTTFIGVPPVQAHHGSRQDCKTAFLTMQSTLNENKNVEVLYGQVFSLEGYKNFPIEAPYGLTIGMQGSGVKSLLSNPKQLPDIANRLIQGCSRLSLVRFKQNQTKNYVEYGLVKKQVTAFHCNQNSALTQGSSGTLTKIPWGATAACQ